jgi:hypothetical protein
MLDDDEAIKASQGKLDRQHTRQPYDNYEISPCCRLDEDGNPDPNGNTYEVCEPHEADVWTLYGHLDGEGVQAIGDFATRDDAEEAFYCITGIEFADVCMTANHLRIMHAGPKLLEALKALCEATSGYARHFHEHQVAVAVIAEATGRSA